VKLFITHGGILSAQEATYHGKPIIGIPIGSDQDINLKRATSDGRGIQLDFDTLTVDGLLAAIKNVTEDARWVSPI
jgi:glucuronosyltransferase